MKYITQAKESKIMANSNSRLSKAERKKVKQLRNTRRSKFNRESMILCSE